MITRDEAKSLTQTAIERLGDPRKTRLKGFIEEAENKIIAAAKRGMTEAKWNVGTGEFEAEIKQALADRGFEVEYEGLQFTVRW